MVAMVALVRGVLVVGAVMAGVAVWTLILVWADSETRKNGGRL